MRSFFFSVKSCAIVLLLSSAAFAGGPLYTLNGKAVRYKSNIITYKVDRGPLGLFSSAQARALVDASFKTWEDVPTSNVMFQHTDADTLAVDVNGTNYLQYTTLTDFKYDGVSPIIFDSDGAITEDLFGTGSSESVIGFAGSGDQDNDGYFDEGESVMNGLFADGSQYSYSLAEWKSTFVHEFGHFLGLDHAQINGEFESDTAKTIYIPTMYPYATVNDVPLGDLNPDDIAAISQLYPETGYASTVGTITGTALRTDGSKVRGANVIAISTGADSLMNRISTVTDYFEQNSGAYALLGLAPGSYVVRIEPIDPDFTGGSSVGPYAEDESGLSFVDPVVAEYYNGANESGDPAVDDPEARTPVAVAAAGTVSGIDFICTVAPAAAMSFSEDFTASAGTALTSAGWSLSGTSNVNPISVVQPGLSFAGWPADGNAALLKTSGQDVYSAFTPADQGSMYLSFLMKVDSVKTGDYFIALSPSTAQTNYYARFHLKAAGAGFSVGISKYSEKSGGSKYGTTVYQLHTTYLVIVKYEFLAGTSTDDQLSVFVLPSSLPAVEPADPEITAYTATASDPANLGLLTLRQGSATAAPYLVVDGIRIGSAWPGLVTQAKDIAATGLPETMQLMQNYPNPFNPSTRIRFALPAQAHVRLRVFDLAGRALGVIAEGTYAAGVHEATFNATHLASGTYFYMLEAGTHREIRRMLLVK